MSPEEKQTVKKCRYTAFAVTVIVELIVVILVFASGYRTGDRLSASFSRIVALLQLIPGATFYFMGRKAYEIKRFTGKVMKIIGIACVAFSIIIFLTAGIFGYKLR